MRTLLIDNHDSFTWNIAQYIAEVSGVEPLVVLNNTFSWVELMKMGPFDALVLSPGPGTVQRPADFGVSRLAIERTQVPLLGICLGHQGIAHVHGATVMHAPEPVHGRISLVYHDGDALFAGIPSPWQVVRYHSLAVCTPLPDSLIDIARTASGVLMGLRHRTRPLWGVQFHPESVLTQHGLQLMRNFRDIACRQRARSRIALPRECVTKAADYVVQARELDTALGAEDLFIGLFGAAEHAFWLDSALAVSGQQQFSYLGAVGGQGVLRFACPHDAARRTQEGAAFLNTLQQFLARTTAEEPTLPFPFRGGLIGYFGYEMKSVFGAELVHHCEYPDAVWMHAERFIAIDHLSHRVWAVNVADAAARVEAERWLQDIAQQVAALQPADRPTQAHGCDALQLELDQSRSEYLHSIAACQRAIRDGESYQVCLTNKMSHAGRIDGLQLYRELRRSNPAPFAAYLRSGELEILSASPERFLQVERSGRIETKPIKGTCRRDTDPQLDRALAEQLRHSEKNRAENLMIVDLLRNDLGRVAETGSVQVPSLMQVESFATLHQLVTTVSAQLRRDCSLIDLIAATFPGGSVTGAPKLRTLQLIDRLERSARGVYCGCIGYLGYDRVLQLSIAIRTMTRYRDQLSFGIGGGITHLSDGADEFDETLLKGFALIRALWQHRSGGAEMCYGLSHRSLQVGTVAGQAVAHAGARGEAECSVS